MENRIKEEIRKSIQVKEALLNDAKILSLISEVSKMLAKSMQNGGKLLIAGNGGSAADSQHISAEFVSKFKYDRPGLPSIALTTDTSALTAIGNDYGYDKLFERQIQSIGSKGDIFIGISTSGNSPNVRNAFIEARKKGIVTVGFGGLKGFHDLDLDYEFCIPSLETARIQESHILLGHLICGLVEEMIFPSN